MSEQATNSGSGTGTPDQAMPASASGKPRLLGLDFTRGIAVLGILAANIAVFGQPFSAGVWPGAFLAPHGETSNWLWVVQLVLIDGKMRGLFTILFGAGLVLFMDKAWQKGQTRWLQARRLLFLLLFGLIHFYFIWRGDILVLYAAAGFVGMFCLRWSANNQLVAGLLGYVAGALVFAAVMGFPYFVADTSLGEQNTMADVRTDLEVAKAEEVADGVLEQKVHEEASYGAYLGHVFEKHATDPLGSLIMFIFETLPLMLVGMGLYRYGLFNGGFDPGKQRKWGWIGIIAGTALTIPIALWALNTGLTYWGTIAAFMGFSPLPRLAVILGLAAVLALWGETATGWLGQRFIAAGRMAFSNYLGTSILMMFIFHGWAGGLFGKLTRPELYLVVLATWIVMLLWSKAWLDRFRYGPLEWLWRCLTYGKMFPLRR